MVASKKSETAAPLTFPLDSRELLQSEAFQNSLKYTGTRVGSKMWLYAAEDVLPVVNPARYK